MECASQSRSGSERVVCRLLPHMEADGPGNMALDEALLEAVAADPTGAVFRTYGWTVPTLSLGYFQRVVRPAVGTCVFNLA